MLPKTCAPALFGLILSGLMSLLVSGISTYRAVGFSDGYAGLWTSAWLTAWLVAFPVVLVWSSHRSRAEPLPCSSTTDRETAGRAVHRHFVAASWTRRSHGPRVCTCRFRSGF
jgi:hypothetical protein